MASEYSSHSPFKSSLDDRRPRFLWRPVLAIFRFFETRLDPYPENLNVAVKGGGLAFIWTCLQGSRGWIFAIILVNAFIGAYEAIQFWLMGVIVDWMNNLTPAMLWEQKHYYLLAMLAFIIFGQLVNYLRSHLIFQVMQGNFPMRLRWIFHQTMLRQSLGFFNNEFSGRVSAKVMQTALAVRDFVNALIDVGVYILIFFVSTLMVLSQFDLRLLIPFLCWLVIYVLILWWCLPKLRESAERQADARSMLTGRITDAYANINSVKLFSFSHREAGYAKMAMKSMLSTVHDQMRWASIFEISNYILCAVLIVGTTATSLYLWTYDLITVGACSAAIALAIRLQGLSYWIMGETSHAFENYGVLRDGQRMLATPPGVVDIAGAKDLKVTAGRIRFEHLSFRFQDGVELFNDFNLSIHPGEKVGLVGRSGAGKTSLLNLLLRFYNLQGGQILIDNQDIATITQESLRAQIGMVAQDTSLLHRSIRDNISYGRPNASEAEIIEAARRANAFDFIEHIIDGDGRKGLDVMVGERGVKLSGGQRQRIAIARVMLKNAPILLLDEATSALDSEVEAAIQETLYSLMEGKTVVAIAHRLSTIAAMDRLIVMDKGKIVESGSHEELLRADGIYARLWHMQSGGFLPE